LGCRVTKNTYHCDISFFVEATQTSLCDIEHTMPHSELCVALTET
jgi:hypothetical protein